MEKAENEDDCNFADRISDLPKQILYNILYVMSQKEAAKTCVLSKSWRYLWTNRPTITFSEISFKGTKKAFLFRVDNTLQSHLDHNLRITEFHLTISLLDSDSTSLLEKWIPLLKHIGVKLFYLSILSKNQDVDLPPVVFKAESLNRLSLKRCNIFDRKIIENIPFLHLQVLRLRDVSITNTIFDKIISSCPLLATMLFEECIGLKKIKLEKKLHKHLKHFTFIKNEVYRRYECHIEIDIPTLETIKIVGSKIRFHVQKYSYLHSLSLIRMKLYSDSFDGYEFPRLRALTLCRCHGLEKLQLCINAPTILYFKYVGRTIPSISFTATSEKWRSDILVRILDNIDDAAPWFLKLSGLLHALSQSEISLKIEGRTNIPNIDHQEEILVQDIIKGSHKPNVVENLELSKGLLSSFPSILFGLFCICRPRKLAHPSYEKGECEEERDQKKLADLLCEFLMKGHSGDQEYFMQYLKGLSIEGFHMSREQWLPLQGRQKFLESALHGDSIRFRLKWSEACESSSKLDDL